MGQNPAQNGPRRPGWAVRLARGIIVAVMVLVVSITCLTQCTHGEISMGKLASNWEPVRLIYRIRVVFKDQVPTDFELLAPVPLIDGCEVPGFRQAVARDFALAEVVDTERGEFLRVTQACTHGSRDFDSFVVLQLKEAPRHFLASTHLAERLSLSGQQNDGEAWVYLRSDCEISHAWIWVQLGNSYLELKSELFRIPEGAVETGWRLLPEGVGG